MAKKAKQTSEAAEVATTDATPAVDVREDVTVVTQPQNAQLLAAALQVMLSDARLIDRIAGRANIESRTAERLLGKMSESFSRIGQ